MPSSVIQTFDYDDGEQRLIVRFVSGWSTPTQACPRRLQPDFARRRRRGIILPKASAIAFPLRACGHSSGRRGAHHDDRRGREQSQARNRSALYDMALSEFRKRKVGTVEAMSVIEVRFDGGPDHRTI
jgi:hypothetical protein